MPPDTNAREESIRRFERIGGMLTGRTWMARTLELTWVQVGQLGRWGYPFPTDAHGNVRRSSLQGPEYMRLMRRQVKRAGVTILDQSPALELLADADGVVSGAGGVHRQRADAPWAVRAGAVVLATGGCAFLSGALGCNPDTGDGHLMAAELGAEMSGMEFSAAYGMAPAFGSQTKGRMYQFARYYRADHSALDPPSGPAGRSAACRAALEGPVYARLELAPPQIHQAMRWAQPNFFLPFDKAGIDPFTDLFEIRLVLEGTVRGTGGIAVQQVWTDQLPRLGGDRGRQRAREAAAMTAHARWMYAAALSREESRGMHQRDDCSATDPAQARRLRVSGLETVRVAPEARW